MIGGIIGAVRAALSLAAVLTEHLRNKKLIEAGKAEAIAEALHVASKEMAKVAANRARYKRDPEYADRLRDSFKIKQR